MLKLIHYHLYFTIFTKFLVRRYLKILLNGKKKKEETEFSLLFRAYSLQILRFFACEILNGIVYLLVLSDEKSIIKNSLNVKCCLMQTIERVLMQYFRNLKFNIHTVVLYIRYKFSSAVSLYLNHVERQQNV